MSTEPNNLDANQRAEAFNYLVGQLFHQKSSALDKIRADVAAAAVPIPPDLLRRLSLLNPIEIHDALREHPGRVLWDRSKSYRISYEVFVRSFDDLINSIDAFEKDAQDGTLFEHMREFDLTTHEQIIQKELFGAANAAHSLVDHSSNRLQKLAQVPDFRTQLQTSFGIDGLHDFVINLRTLLHHLHVIKPGYQWEKRFEKDAVAKVGFMLDRAGLLRVAEETFDPSRFNKVEGYLHKAPKKIDLKLIFVEYKARVVSFHASFSAALDAHAYENVRDYDRCVLENKRFATRTWWNAMLGNWLRNWKVPPNPYNHLAKYLSPEQLVEVYKLPMRSAEQVDKVIEFVDVDGACDEHIRTQAYELFQRAPDLT
jgi:hypothetical protein